MPSAFSLTRRGGDAYQPPIYYSCYRCLINMLVIAWSVYYASRLCNTLCISMKYMYRLLVCPILPLLAICVINGGSAKKHLQ